MTGKQRTVFPGNNSSQGFYSFYASGLSATEKIHILKGGPGTGKSSLMRHVAETCRKHGIDVELWQCSSDNDSLDGVLIPSRSVAVIDGTAPHIMDPIYPGVRETIINLGAYWDEAILARNKCDIISISRHIAAVFNKAYDLLREAARYDAQLRDDRREKHIFDFDAETLLGDILKEDTPLIRHLFAAAVTPKGVIDLRRALCLDHRQRIYLIGGKRSQREICLKKIIAAGKRRGLAIDIFHGHLDPEEIILVSFPKRGVVFSTAEQFPPETREGDKIIRFDSVPLFDEQQKALTKRDALIDEAVAHLRVAHRLHDELERYYIAAMDFDAVDSIAAELSQNILKSTAGL